MRNSTIPVLIALALLLPLYGCTRKERLGAHRGVDHLQQYLLSSSSITVAVHARKLKQAATSRVRQVPAVPQCMWNEVREACIPSQLAYLAVNAEPVSVFHRAAVVAYDRNLLCTGHADEKSCNKDTQNRCMYWSKSCVGADAYELVNWSGGDVLDGAATTLAFTCSGTPAAEYRACLTATDAGAEGICNQLPGCHFVTVFERCMPTSWDNKTLKQVQQLSQGFDMLSAAVWGSCAGACYARQAAACQKLSNDSATCLQKPYCVWEVDAFEAKKTCIHKDTAARSADAFSKDTVKFKEDCSKQTTQDACEKLKVVPINVGKYRTAPGLKAAEAPTSNCKL